MSFEARYAGWCEECGFRFDIGDQIIGNPKDGYQHAGCKPVESAPAKICPTCWLTVSPSGACGCEST